MPYRKVGYIEQCFYIIKYAIADKVRKRKERRTAKAIESALHIKLTDMQKQYIFGRSEWTLTGRCTGKTTAYCIKICISEGDAIVIRFGQMPPQFLDGLNTSWYNRFYTCEFLRIYKALSKTNIRLREVKIEDAGRSKNIC
ncbi:MAG: hypothetical protein PUA58_05665 [Ruminococcus sp.]|nr:hypothetical protein [Ruminococcus sp.]